MKPGRYLFNSDGSEYEVEYKETIIRKEDGKRKRSTDWWAICVKSETKQTPGPPFRFDAEKWEHLERIGYIKIVL